MRVETAALSSRAAKQGLPSRSAVTVHKAIFKEEEEEGRRGEERSLQEMAEEISDAWSDHHFSFLSKPCPAPRECVVCVVVQCTSV